MPEMVLWVLPVAGGVLSLLFLGRHRQAAVVRDWEFLLSPELDGNVKALDAQVALDGSMLDHAYDRAERARQEARAGEAVRLLALALSVVEQAVPDRLTRLRAMSVCCRMAAAIAPLPPIRPRALELRQLMARAGICAALHHLLTSGVERFRIRLGLLSVGFRTVLRVMTRSAGRVTRNSGAATAWDNFSAARSDFKELDREHVATFSALLASLAAQQR